MRAVASRDPLTQLRAYAERVIAERGADAPSCDGVSVQEAVMAALAKYDPDKPGSVMDTHIQITVASAPPLGEEQKHKLRALLGFGMRAIDDPVQLAKGARIMRGAMTRRELAEQQQLRDREVARDLAEARRALRRRRDPMEVAVEILQQRMNARRPGGDPR